ncbi:MAG TPA: DAK2 domain-containing protein [Actinomycetota bacterium]
MPRLERLTAAGLRSAMDASLRALRSHAQAINGLNVYPVPDADTGTNMTLTVESVVRALDDAEPDMRSTARAIARGSLLGARGISGIILSQILRTLADRFAPSDAVAAADLAEALAEASGAARRAVHDPVEGTILTVARAAGDAATVAAGGGADLVGVLEAARTAAAEAVARTPDLLPPLKAAGVVDAGGTGFVVFLDGWLSTADGRPLPEPPPTREVAAPIALPGGGEHGGDHRYEVSCLLEAPDEVVPALRESWGRLGGAVVLVGGQGLWTCHLHTDEPGEAIEAVLGFGRPRNVRLTDLVLQTVEERGLPPEVPEERVATAAVAVATGDGLRRLFRSLGARVTTGSRSSAPSVGELLEAVETARASGVVLVPGDDRIRPAADEAARLAPVPVRVVPCRGVVEQLAALRAYDPDDAVEEDALRMAESAASVRSGWIVRAVRDADTDAGPVHEGDWLALTPEGAVGVAPGPVEAATGLLGRLIGDTPEILTVVEGEGATDGTTTAILARVDEMRGDVGVQILRGGQPHQAYAFGVE